MEKNIVSIGRQVWENGRCVLLWVESGCSENCLGRTVDGWHVVGQRPDTRKAGVGGGLILGGERWQRAAQVQRPSHSESSSNLSVSC